MSLIAKTPEQTTEVFVQYFNEGNLDNLIAAYYADGAVLAAAPGQPASGSALLVIDWVIQAKDAEGKPLSIFGTSTDVVRRGGDGVWRCVIDNPHNVR